MKKLFILLAAMATLVACDTKELAPADLAGEWMIAKVGETTIANSAETLLAFNDSLQMYSAYVGCNRINGTYLSTDSLVLTDGLSTKMYCEGLMELEQELCISLPQVKKAVSCEDGKVALQNVEGKTLLVIKRLPSTEIEDQPLPLPHHRPEQED